MYLELNLSKKNLIRFKVSCRFRPKCASANRILRTPLSTLVSGRTSKFQYAVSASKYKKVKVKIYLSFKLDRAFDGPNLYPSIAPRRVVWHRLSA